VKSPTAATIDSATVASMPGTLINRSTSETTQPDLTELGVDKPQFLGVEVQLPQQRHRRSPLIGRQVLVGQPGAALVPE
jgi:hypothetical protein